MLHRRERKAADACGARPERGKVLEIPSILRDAAETHALRLCKMLAQVKGADFVPFVRGIGNRATEKEGVSHRLSLGRGRGAVQ